LGRARELAAEARALLASAKDPVQERKSVATAAVQVPSFGELAQTVIASLEPGWRNDKHRYQWQATIATYCAPIAAKPVNAITTEDVLGVLQPIWAAKNETASRLRGRMEKILDAAKAKGYRSGENPARWRGHLDHLLPRRQKLQRGHHPALPYQELPHFMTRLREHKSVAALALEFCILTAGRSGEVLGASWAEIDFEAKVWTIPPPRMKSGRQHRVPLSPQALAILDQLRQIHSGDFVFPSPRNARPLSNMAMEMLLRRMKADAITVHGFRSSF